MPKSNLIWSKLQICIMHSIYVWDFVRIIKKKMWQFHLIKCLHSLLEFPLNIDTNNLHSLMEYLLNIIDTDYWSFYWTLTWGIDTHYWSFHWTLTSKFTLIIHVIWVSIGIVTLSFQYIIHCIMLDVKHDIKLIFPDT